MGVKPDSWIKRMALEKRMLEPFVDRKVKDGNISYGLSHYGYDIRLADEFKLPSPDIKVIDPKNIQAGDFTDFKGSRCDIPANSFLLARSMEYFRMPNDVLGICIGKSTYARSGIIVNVTPLEPGWEGYLTISIANAGSKPVRLYAGEGCAQVIFIEASQLCEVTYDKLSSKYHASDGIVTSGI
ncbi:MAG: dCTP deaminase [Candidatus Omnitrophica bacterium CG1_02_49_10]|nr:MAG: dCTP deaminase [Candidatus Omnitrophica bacterium CG1_02_49_10]